MDSQIICTLIAFAAVIAICPVLLPFLHRLKFGQVVRQLGPEGHYKKAGTPTMGGIAIILAIIIATSVYLKNGSSNLLFAVVVTVLFGIIGFLDDFIKVVQKNAIKSEKGLSMASLGMKPLHKIILQLAVAAAVAVYVAFHPNIGTDILIPFASKYWDLGSWFIPFIIFTIIAVVNAVNLTDGLDGLAAGVTMIVCIFFFVAAMGNGMRDMGYFMASVIGACLGFLCFNFNPAKVFMGDNGCTGRYLHQNRIIYTDRGSHIRNRGSFGHHADRLL